MKAKTVLESLKDGNINKLKVMCEIFYINTNEFSIENVLNSFKDIKLIEESSKGNLYIFTVKDKWCSLIKNEFYEMHFVKLKYIDDFIKVCTDYNINLEYKL